MNSTNNRTSISQILRAQAPAMSDKQARLALLAYTRLNVGGKDVR
jgi:hypothetical protein